MKAAFDRRVEVLFSIRRTPQQAGDARPFPLETFGSALASTQGALILQEGLGPEYKLTRNGVDACMNSHKKQFYLFRLLRALISLPCASAPTSSVQLFSGHGEEHVQWQEALAAVVGE